MPVECELDNPMTRNTLSIINTLVIIVTPLMILWLSRMLHHRDKKHEAESESIAKFQSDVMQITGDLTSKLDRLEGAFQSQRELLSHYTVIVQSLIAKLTTGG